MSLLFLGTADDAYRDGNGDLLAAMTLQFYEKGTTVEAPVYSDAALENEIAQPIAANGAGVFATTIYLDTAVDYRVVMKRADGDLIYDCPDYQLDLQTTGANTFRAPRVHALSSDVPVPGATLGFFSPGTDTKKAAYADPDLQVPLPNPLTCDSGGFFPAIYLNGSYRIVPDWGPSPIDPYPPQPFAVTIANYSGSSYGYRQGVAGSIDPPDVEVSGEQPYTIGAQPGFFFLILQSASPPALEGDVYVETDVEGVYVTLAAADATQIEGGYRWGPGAGVDWGAGNVGQERTVQII